MKKRVKTVVMGGGTGIFPVTTALKKLPVDIKTIIAVSDSGGSTGKIRDEFGFQPVGDLRQSLAALAEGEGQEWIKKLLLYRFEKGSGLKGHNLGNLILTALQDMTQDTTEALARAEQIFRLEGEVIPATEEFVDLKIIYQDGSEAIGEVTLDKNNFSKKIRKVELTPECHINPHAADAIKNADLVIIGPGDYYASLMATLAPKGTQRAIKQSQGKVVYILNLMTRITQTKDMSATDHVRGIEKRIGRNIDVILINDEPIPEDILHTYQKSGEHPIENDLTEDNRVVTAHIISKIKHQKKYQDNTHRELLRHDSKKLQQVLKSIINQT